MLSLEELEARAMLSITGPQQEAAILPSPAGAADTSAILAQAQTAAISSVRDGLWSNPATWSSGQVPAATGLWGLHGATIDLEGPAVTSWLNAAASGASQNLGHGVSQQVSFGATSATLQSAPIGWQAGDTLLLVNEQGQNVLADLVSVN